MLKQAFSYLSFLIVFSSFLGCNLPNNSNKKNLAPKNIGNSSFTLKYKSTNPGFRSIVGRDLTYFFHTDLTYESFLDGKPYRIGDYAYNKTDPDSGTLAISYSLGPDVANETLSLYFLSDTKGEFESIPYSEDLDLESGTFTFNPQAIMPSSQNVACDKLPVDSGKT